VENEHENKSAPVHTKSSSLDNKKTPSIVKVNKNNTEVVDNNGDKEKINENDHMNKEISEIFVPMRPDNSWKVRIIITIHHSAKDVYNFLVLGYIKNKDGMVQGWNRKVIDWKPLVKLDDQHIIYQETYKSFNSPYKFRHFVVLRYLKPNPEKGIYKVMFASVSNYESFISERKEEKKIEIRYEELTETNADTKDIQKAYILPSGFHIEQDVKNQNQCQLEFIAHLTPESVLILAPDLLGETNELFESVASIGHLVGAMKANMSSSVIFN